jgi:hypothetical protein
VLQSLFDKLTKLEGAMAWKRMWKKTKLMRIKRKPSPVKFLISKNLDNVGYFKYLGSIMTKMQG